MSECAHKAMDCHRMNIWGEGAEDGGVWLDVCRDCDCVVLVVERNDSPLLRRIVLNDGKLQKELDL